MVVAMQTCLNSLNVIWTDVAGVFVDDATVAVLVTLTQNVTRTLMNHDVF